ncbi:hypothetical protein V6N12_001430 [Hibiscus sabdariffa]|uniref:RNase H type-1 domain-containing protein n=1 Tax=Hibiscus sabdariffa TaxID=183260 RepID=A0ABR2A183_9ROSI
MAELWAISNGLVHGWRMGLRKIILQSDNRMVIDILQGKSMALNNSDLFSSIREMLSHVRIFEVIILIVQPTVLVIGWLSWFGVLNWGNIALPYRLFR